MFHLLIYIIDLSLGTVQFITMPCVFTVWPYTLHQTSASSPQSAAQSDASLPQCGSAVLRECANPDLQKREYSRSEHKGN